MILTKTIKIELNKFNSHHFKRLGYEVEGKEDIDVKIEDIGKGTMVKIDVECDLCKRQKQIGYRKYWKNFNKYGTYTCSNKCAMFKNKKTNFERYGTEHQNKNEEIKNNIIKTKLERGLISIDIDKFEDYRRIVNNITKKLKKNLFETWNGLDYYDSEYIKDNLNLDCNHSEYPSIDHKVSVLWGFNNKIDVNEIASVPNLCITKRRLNSSKNFKNEDMYKKIRLSPDYLIE